MAYFATPGVTVKNVDVFDSAAGDATDTSGARGVAMSAAGIDAVSFVLDTTVVGRVEPSHFIAEVDTNRFPVTVSVNPGSPATAELGVKVVINGPPEVGVGVAVSVRLAVAVRVEVAVAVRVRVALAVSV